MGQTGYITIIGIMKQNWGTTNIWLVCWRYESLCSMNVFEEFWDHFELSFTKSTINTLVSQVFSNSRPRCDGDINLFHFFLWLKVVPRTVVSAFLAEFRLCLPQNTCRLGSRIWKYKNYMKNKNNIFCFYNNSAVCYNAYRWISLGQFCHIL